MPLAFQYDDCRPRPSLRREREAMRRALIAKGFCPRSPKLDTVLGEKMRRKYGRAS